MTSIGVGAALRQERLQRQLSIEDVARQTRIAGRFLNAIEADDFAILPGLIFARNFVRQYAAMLDVDPTPLLAKLPTYDLESAPMPARQLVSAPSSWWDPRWNSVIASIAWIVLACGAAAAAYLYFNRIPRAEPTAPSATSAGIQPVEPQASTPKDIPAVAQGAAPVASATPVDSSTSEEHPVRVVVTARDDSWLQVTADGKTAFVGILKAGESRNFDSDGTVKVRTGNAGGIDISLNGKKLDSLGLTGEIRTVSLTAEGPQYAPKTPPVSPDPA